MLSFSALGRAALGQVPASGQIQHLQVALRGLAQAAGKANWDPGSVSGELTTQTIAALGNVVAQVSAEIPAVRAALPNILPALKAALTDSRARPMALQVIVQYATQLTAAIRRYTMRNLQSERAPAYDHFSGFGQVPNIFTRVRDVGTTAAQRTTASLSTVIRSPVTASSGPSPSAGAPGGVKIYPAGTISARTATGAWRVAVPRAAAKAALGGIDLAEGEFVEVPGSTTQPIRQVAGFGFGFGFGQSSVATVPQTEAAPEVDEKQFEKDTKKPWYKQWQTYAIAGGVVVAVGGAYYLLK